MLQRHRRLPFSRLSNEIPAHGMITGGSTALAYLLVPHSPKILHACNPHTDRGGSRKVSSIVHLNSCMTAEPSVC